MQALWSRTAQLQSSCCCKLCLQTGRTLARRSTTAAFRRKVSGADIFTAFYTTILGTAAILDASKKDVKRQELDQKLEKARAELTSLKEDTSRQDRERGSRDGRNRKKHAVRSRQHHDANGLKTTATAKLLQDLGQLAAKTYKGNQRPSWLDAQIHWVDIESAIVSEEKDRTYRPRLPRSDQHMELATVQIERLVQQLILRCQAQEEEKQKLRGPTAEMKEERLLDEIQELRNHFPCYTASGKDIAGDAKARSLLSESFRRIFNSATSAKEAVARICYNLLVSSTPPNIHNYNTLIAGFNRIQHPELADAVVMSYLHNCRWPATEQTIICLLNHARGTDNFHLFREIVQRMRGAVADGLHNRVMGKDAICSEELQRWAREKAFEQTHRFVQKSLRSNGTYESVIRGWLHFRKVDCAAMSFVACIRNGYSVSVDTIDQLLSSILANLDRTSARTIIRGLVKNFANFQKVVNSLDAKCASTLTQKLADMFHALFDIADFPPILNFVKIRLELGGVLDVFGSLRQAMIAKSQKSLDGITDEMEKFSFLQASRKQEERVKKYRNLASAARIAKRYRTLEATTRRLSALVKVSILKLEIGCDLDPQSQLPPVIWNERRPNQRYPAVFQALRSIELDHRPLSVDEVKAQLLAGMPDQVFAGKLRSHPDWRTLSFQALVSFYEEQPRAIKHARVPEKALDPQLLADEIDETADEEDTRALLFSHLDREDQQILKDAAPKGYKLPLPKLATPDQLLSGELEFTENKLHLPKLFQDSRNMLPVITAQEYAPQLCQLSG